MTIEAPLKHVRYLQQGDKTGRAELLKAGYEFRGISKKGSEIFVLPDRTSASIEEEAINHLWA